MAIKWPKYNRKSLKTADAMKFMKGFISSFIMEFQFKIKVITKLVSQNALKLNISNILSSLKGNVLILLNLNFYLVELFA